MLHPLTWCVTLCRVLTTREAYQTLWCPEFLLALDHTLPAWLTFSLLILWEVWTNTFSSFKHGNWYAWPKVSIISHVVKPLMANAPSQNKTQNKTKTNTLLSFQGPTNHLLVAEGWKPDFSLGEVNCSQHNYINEEVLETYGSFLIPLTLLTLYFPLCFLRFSLYLDLLNVSL